MLVRTVLPLILTFVNNTEPIGGRTRFQKMVFLLSQHARFFKNKYDFIPHDYGPYSKELQNDIDYLIKEGFLTEDRITIEDGKIKYEYSITAKGESFVNDVLSNEKLDKKFQFSRVLELSDEVKNELNHQDLYSLLSKIYQEYPEYAKYSKLQY